MLYDWYDSLLEVVPDVGEIERAIRYTDGSTTCTIYFCTQVNNLEVIIDWFRAVLKFDGWMEIIKIN